MRCARQALSLRAEEMASTILLDHSVELYAPLASWMGPARRPAGEVLIPVRPVPAGELLMHRKDTSTTQR